MSTVAISGQRDITPGDYSGRLRAKGVSVGTFQDQLMCAAIAPPEDHNQQDELSTDDVVIYRYIPQSSDWEMTYKGRPAKEASATLLATLSEGLEEGRSAPDSTPALEEDLEAPSHEDAFRVLAFNGQSVPTSALEVYIFSSQQSWVLASTDGHEFTWFALADADAQLLRSQSSYTLTGHALHGVAEASSSETVGAPNRVLVAAVPSARGWRIPLASEWNEITVSPLEDVRNKEIAVLNSWDNTLCLGINNPSRGCQVWQAQVQEPPNYRWTCLVQAGAFRYSLNQIVFAMTPFNGDLYVACGVPKTAPEASKPFYPCGFELIRVYPNHDWDVLIGSPKFTPNGLRVPLSAMGPGLDDPNRAQVQALFTHQTALYMATQGTEGFELWLSLDGEQWEPIPLEGLDQYYQVRVKNVFSMDFGLVMELDLCNFDGEIQPRILLLS
jgi:hypothetical protein